MVFNVFLRVEKKCFVSRQPKLLNNIHSRHTLVDSETDTNHTHSHTKCACELLIIFYFLSTYSFRVIFISFQVVFDLHRLSSFIRPRQTIVGSEKRRRFLPRKKHKQANIPTFAHTQKAETHTRSHRQTSKFQAKRKSQQTKKKEERYKSVVENPTVRYRCRRVVYTLRICTYICKISVNRKINRKL